jgi:hypothetical protein
VAAAGAIVALVFLPARAMDPDVIEADTVDLDPMVAEPV